jgi:hypothetical protein
MELQLPPGSFPGQAVQLIVVAPTDEPSRTLPGLVVVPAPSDPDPLAIEPSPGLVAVPEEFAAAAAVAIAEGRVSAILGGESGH